MANRKISELSSRTPSLSDLMLVGDPSSGYSYKCTITALATIIETDIADGYVTIGTTQTISGAKTFSNVLTLTSVANATTTQTKFLTLNGSNVVNYRTGAEVLSDIGGASAASLSGYVPTSRTITINGTAYDLSANRSWSVGTVTSVAATAGTGISISGSPITSSGTLTITNTAPDQTVVLTAGTGISVSGTYPNFTITNSSPSSGGTVTSVGLSSATSGVTIGSTPITTSGTITLAIATASGSQQGLLSSTDWNTFNNKQNALTNPVTGTGTTNYIPKFTGTSSIGNSAIYDNSGNIGFNTTSPTALIHAVTLGTPITAGAGTVAVFQRNQFNYNGASISIVGGNVGSSTLNFGDADSETVGLINYDHNANAMIFQTNASERMRLDASGNLGLGTSSPAYTLDVNGSINSTSLIRITPTTATANALFRSVNTGGTAYLGLDNSTGGLTSAYALNVYHSGAYPIIFSTNSTERMRLDASGNLGLGVTPSAWYSLLRAIDIGAGGSVQGRSDAAGTFEFATNAYLNTAGSWTYKASSVSANLFAMSDGSYKFYTAPSGTAGNAISFTQAMTLDASGRLGIGTTSPGAKLAVNGNLSIGNGYGTSGATIDMSADATASNGSTIEVSYWGSGSYGPLMFKTGNAERMRITSGGELLINTTSDAGDYKLQVNGNTYLNGFTNFIGYSEINANATTWGLQIKNSNAGGYGLFIRNGDDTKPSLRINNAADTQNSVQIFGDGKIETTGSIKTAAPSGYTAKSWKFGERVVTGVTFDATQYIAVEIDGTTYYLATVTIN